MKAGTSASIFTYRYLHRLRERLAGRLTLTAVSDEETFGPWGARYLMEHHPEVHGDCLLNGEPSSPLTIRFGEKGPLWLRFTVRTPGAHGAYTHLTPSATKIAARIIVDLEDLTTIPADVPIDVADALAGAAAAIDEAQGAGAKDIVQQVTVNIGVIHGGQKVNMVPGTCWFEADIRLPPGVGKDAVMARVQAIAARYPEAAMEEINFSAPSVCDPNHAMVGILRANARALGRPEPAPDRQPRRHRRAALASARHPRARPRPVPPRHGPGRRARRDRGVPAHRPHARAIGVRLPLGVIGSCATRTGSRRS